MACNAFDVCLQHFCQQYLNIIIKLGIAIINAITIIILK